MGYRVVGSGPPLVLIMGYGWTMEGWDPGWYTRSHAEEHLLGAFRIRRGKIAPVDEVAPRSRDRLGAPGKRFACCGHRRFLAERKHEGLHSFTP